MKKNSFSITIILIIQFFLISELKAQIQLYALDVNNSTTAKQIEYEATSALNHINHSYENNVEPSWSRLETIQSSFKNDIEAIWSTSVIRIDEDTLYRPAIYLTGGDIEIRDIQISLITVDSTYFEEAVLTFNSQGNLKRFMIGLPQHRYSKYIYEATEEIDRKRRQVILNFVEQFRTAYNTKNTPLIERVFSDQALIIVGNVINTSNEMSPFQQQVEYLRLTKTEYISRLKQVFERNQFIDIKFDNISILRHPNPDFNQIYGVNIVQNYRSSSYSDDGYLFLLIDFRKDELNPMIHVRTWQPLNETNSDEIFMIGDFALY